MAELPFVVIMPDERARRSSVTYYVNTPHLAITDSGAIRLDNLASAFNDPSTREKALEWAREYGVRK